MLIRTQSNRNSHLLLLGRQNSMATLEEKLAVSCKIEHTLTRYHPTIVFFGVYTKVCLQQKSAHRCLFITAKLKCNQDALQSMKG